ncbi:hypothetical protein GH714_027477 [Hevea brasiliensis]|uniref:Uncharacterized protein n=1 Tax=Hevea brasiliensis TaxID=3981 RepID=A0A6A6K739_HEVBR|nr:hypothetical protein GH714_027477 [Hevea brasiliensis]
MTKSAVVDQDAVKMAQMEERLDLLQGESRETRKEMEILKQDFKKLQEGIKKDAAENKIAIKTAVGRLETLMLGFFGDKGKEIINSDERNSNGVTEVVGEIVARVRQLFL